MEGKLLANQGKSEVFPDLVCVSLRELKAEGSAFFVLGVLPNWLDTLYEQINSGSFRHLTWALQVLVHAPKLVNCVKVS